MVRKDVVCLVALASALACGCAQTNTDAPPSLLTDPPLTNDAAAFNYHLSADEQKYGCKKLTGIMQVRILQIRSDKSREKSTLAARGLQSVVRPVFGGTTAGQDPDGQYTRDRAMLEAYNAQLAAKKCKTFDLAAELKATGPNDLPGAKAPQKKP